MSTPTPPIVYCNGTLLPADRAMISPMDRGFLFGHGVYEGLRTIPDADGVRIVGLTLHLERMRDGLRSIGCSWDVNKVATIVESLLVANHLRDAFVYIQVTEGVPPVGSPLRRRLAPEGSTPTVFAFCEPVPPLDPNTPPAARTAISVEDQRWLLGHLKSTSLSANVMACQHAAQAGCDDLLFIRDGRLIEGGSTNVLLALPGATEPRIATPSLDSGPLLDGVTRRLMLDAIPEIESRVVSTAELASASEILLVGTNTVLASVVALDGRPIGNGVPGPQAARLRRALVEHILRGA